MEGWGLEVAGRVLRWEALGKAVSAEAEPRSVAEPIVLSLSLFNLTPLFLNWSR